MITIKRLYSVTNSCDMGGTSSRGVRMSRRQKNIAQNCFLVSYDFRRNNHIYSELEN